MQEKHPCSSCKQRQNNRWQPKRLHSRCVWCLPRAWCVFPQSDKQQTPRSSCTVPQKTSHWSVTTASRLRDLVPSPQPPPMLQFVTYCTHQLHDRHNLISRWLRDDCKMDLLPSQKQSSVIIQRSNVSRGARSGTWESSISKGAANPWPRTCSELKKTHFFYFSLSIIQS